MLGLYPFWRYYGGKWRLAPQYPAPRHDTIIEPFAGSAGYALRYYQRKVILIERYPVIAEMWRYLISVNPSEVLRIPLVDHVDDLPAWVPQGGRYLIGFLMNAATVSPCRQLSSGRKLLRSWGRQYEGWSEAQRARTAAQVDRIRHWKIIEGTYTQAPDITATWFFDPPYEGSVGEHYVHHSIDYGFLAAYCRSRAGQVIVCEAEGARWLPFVDFRTAKVSAMSRKGGYSKEVLYYQEAA